MGTNSKINFKCVGSHAGVSLGETGPSQATLNDLALFSSIPGNETTNLSYATSYFVGGILS
jgi:transketolase